MLNLECEQVRGVTLDDGGKVGRRSQKIVSRPGLQRRYEPAITPG